MKPFKITKYTSKIVITIHSLQWHAIRFDLLRIRSQNVTKENNRTVIAKQNCQWIQKIINFERYNDWEKLAVAGGWWSLSIVWLSMCFQPNVPMKKYQIMCFNDLLHVMSWRRRFIWDESRLWVLVSEIILTAIFCLSFPHILRAKRYEMQIAYTCGWS